LKGWLADLIHKLDDRGTGSVVFIEHMSLGKTRGQVLEHGHIRVPKTIDRLLRVAHDAHVLEAGLHKPLKNPALQGVCVLELVHHHEIKPGMEVIPDPFIREREIGLQFKIIEIKASVPVLRLLVALIDRFEDKPEIPHFLSIKGLGDELVHAKGHEAPEFLEKLLERAAGVHQ